MSTFPAWRVTIRPLQVGSGVHVAIDSYMDGPIACGTMPKDLIDEIGKPRSITTVLLTDARECDHGVARL